MKKIKSLFFLCVLCAGLSLFSCSEEEISLGTEGQPEQKVIDED